MSKELVISSNRHETKVAILEDDQLVEIYFQRSNEYSLAGSIHKGRVTRVLPGMQSAFVDLGLERDTFLYVSDFFEENEEYDQIAGDDKPVRPARVPPVEIPTLEPPFERTFPVEVAAPAALPSVHEPPPPNSAPTERLEGNDRGGDRRGRRSRRRRNRGGGFPDSKYASDVREDAPKDDEPEPAVAHHDEPAAEVFLLPGESLAKYSRPAPVSGRVVEEPEEEEVEDEPVELASHEPEPDLPLPDKIFPLAPIETVAEPHVVEAVAPEPAPPITEPEPDSSPKPEIDPEPTPSHDIDPDPVSPPEVDPEPEPDTSIHEPEPDSGHETGIEALHSAALASEHAHTEGSDSELPEPEAISASEEMQDLLEDSEVEEPSQGGEETAPATSANVREQSGRYMHRGSRRMRRRTRGGNVADNRTEAPPRPEAVVAPIATAVQPAIERNGRGDKPPLPSITELLKEGQEIIVQIAKEPLGQKGARITSHIALPGRYVVYMPTLDHLGVSRKVGTDEERLRLKRILQTHRVGIPGGYIVRTAGEGHTEEEIAADMSFLFNLWLDIRQKAEKRPAPLLLHHDLDIVQRILRDQLTENFKTIYVDNEELYESVLRFVQRFQPTLVSRVKLYTRPAPVFDAFNITAELEKALRPKVWLKSGGYIVINQTEALVAIDVNTGKYVGKSNRLEDTIVKTNTDAVKEIVRQIRLRDLGGIIVVDFIDMDERKNRQKVMLALEEAMRADRAPYKILQFNDFGLVAITRKRVKQSLERTLCAPCPYCEGAGYVKSVQTIISEILQEAAKIAKVIEGKDAMLRVNPEVAKALKSSDNRFLEEIEEILGKPVLVKSDPLLHHEKFDLI